MYRNKLKVHSMFRLHAPSVKLVHECLDSNSQEVYCIVSRLRCVSGSTKCSTWGHHGGFNAASDDIGIDDGRMQCCSRLMWTILVHFPSEISTLTGHFVAMIFQSPSHFGSSFPVVGFDNQTRSFTLNNRSVDDLSYALFCLAAAEA